MRVSVFVVSALISLGLFSITLPAIAVTNTSADENEASVFFEEVLSHTDNPIIAALAKENLNQLKEGRSSGTTSSNSKVASASTNSGKKIDTQFANFSTTGAIVKPIYGKKLPMVDPEAVEVPLIKGSYASNLVVPATLNRSVTGTFIVDTGATYTVITPALAKELGVNTKNTQKISILTANGWIQAPIVTLNHLSLGNVEVSGIQAVVQDLGGDANLNGLLGMNFFKDIELTIRRDKLVLRIGSSEY